MALPLEAVVKQLTDSGIIAPGTLENHVPPNANPKSVDELVGELVKSNLLTPFQAAQVKAGKAKALILGEYTILDKIGAGGMGQVFKAVHRRMERVVAIKMLPPAMTKDPAALARFQREVVAAAKLSHQNIVHANDAGQAGAAHFLVMEYVDGKDLSVLVKKDGPLPVNKAVNYILQAARGLEFAHGEGVVHRDIKPANLLLDKKGVVKILDMGLARIEQPGGGAQTELTSSGTIMGTVDFMAPEQALNTKYADHRADIYSLGISLYYLLAGKMAYGGETAMEKLMAHQTQPIPNLLDVQTTVPKQLDAIFKKMVAKKIEDRYQSMGEVIEALEELGIGTTTKKGEVASTLALSPEQQRKLGAEAKKKPLSTLTSTVASEQARTLVLKIVGGAFGTIIAPILVFYLIRHLEKQEQTANPPAATAPAATLQPVEVATTQPPHIEHDGSPKPKLAYLDPAFQQWVADTQKLPAEQQIEAVSKKLMELNPGFDGKLEGENGGGAPRVQGGIVTGLRLNTDVVADLSPLRALAGLKRLTCGRTGQSKLADLSPLRGLSLEQFGCAHNDVSDLSPLEGMPLTELAFSGTKVADLSPIRGMPLAALNLQMSPVADLSPVGGMRLNYLNCGGSNVSDLSPIAGMPLVTLITVKPQKITKGVEDLRRMTSLQRIGFDGNNIWPAAEFWKKYDAGEFGKPAAPAKLAYLDPAFQKWVNATQALPADKQIEAVSKKLMELNPGFDGEVSGTDGKGKPRIVNGVVSELGFNTEHVTDLSPVRALKNLSRLSCTAAPIRGALTDLAPLTGMKLERLTCFGNRISDLSPLIGMRLESLNCGHTTVSDLSPLRGMGLLNLTCDRSSVADLSALQGMPLTDVSCHTTQVSDLSFLEDCRSLKNLNCHTTKVTAAQVAALQKALPNCMIEWDDPAKAAKPKLAYLDPAFQQWVADTQKLPAEKQIEAVSKKLMELNPGFDGKLTAANGPATPKIENGVVTGVGFLTDNAPTPELAKCPSRASLLTKANWRA